MSIKEKPLIDAVSELGPLPGFFFASAFFTGFFAMIMCPVFGAVFLLFQAAGRGAVEAIELFEAARVGAAGGVVLGVLIFAGILISAALTPIEARFRLQFVFGGFCAAALVFGLDYVFLETLREYFSNAGPLV